MSGTPIKRSSPAIICRMPKSARRCDRRSSRALRSGPIRCWILAAATPRRCRCCFGRRRRRAIWASIFRRRRWRLLRRICGPSALRRLLNRRIFDTLSREEDLDVIYSNFALHHLDTAQKTEFFRRVARRLTPDGLLLLADVVREEDETLDTYKRRYMHWLRAGWTRLSPQEQEAICDHILAFDFPEPFSVLEAAARAAGLVVAKGGARCGWHRLMCFVKAEAFAPPV